MYSYAYIIIVKSTKNEHQGVLGAPIITNQPSNQKLARNFLQREPVQKTTNHQQKHRFWVGFLR